MFEGALLYDDFFKAFREGKHIINHLPQDFDPFRDKGKYAAIQRTYWRARGCNPDKVVQTFFNLNAQDDCEALLDYLQFKAQPKDIIFVKVVVSSEGKGVTPVFAEQVQEEVG